MGLKLSVSGILMGVTSYWVCFFKEPFFNNKIFTFDVFSDFSGDLSMNFLGHQGNQEQVSKRCTKVNIMCSFLVDLSKQISKRYIATFAESSSHTFQIYSLFRGIWVIHVLSLVCFLLVIWKLEIFLIFLYSDLEIHTNLVSSVSQMVKCLSCKWMT